MAVNALYKIEFGVEPESELALSEALEELRDAAAYLDAVETVRAAMVPRSAAPSVPAPINAVPLDADGKPIVVGAFYIWTFHDGTGGGPCVAIRGGDVVEAGSHLHFRTSHRLARVPISSVSVVDDYGMLIHEVRSGDHVWQGRLTQEQAAKVIECYDADRGAAVDRAAEHLNRPFMPFEPPPPPKPPVRCGQRWRLDGVDVELYDQDTLGVYKARNWDGVRVKVRAADLKERGVFLSGPTEHETHAEAVRRVVDIEAANPPEGIGREEWRAMLINRIGDGIRNTGSVRMVAADARAEVAEKWRKFGGGR